MREMGETIGNNRQSEMELFIGQPNEGNERTTVDNQ